MSHTVTIPGATLSMVETGFDCPSCGQRHEEEDYYKQYVKSQHTTYISCKNKNCKQKLGVAFDIRGDVVVWLKSKEGV